MNLLDPNRRSVSVILERIKPQGNPAEDVDNAKKKMFEEFTDFDADEYKEEHAEEDACIAAAEEILKAFEQKDAKALHLALMDYFTLAEDYEHEGAEEEET
jgi:hypothetical protein